MMEHLCNECRLPFLESPIQYARRIKNKTSKICKDCFRISLAEDRAQERMIYKNMSEKEKILIECKKFKEKNGKISIPLIVRKFNISYDSAKKIFEKI